MKGARIAARLTAIGAVSSSMFLFGCTGDLFFPTTGPGGSGGSGGTTSQGGTSSTGGATGGSTAQGATGGTSSTGGATGGTTQGGGGMAGSGGTTTTGGTGGTTGTTTPMGECIADTDCDAVKGGPAACGTWACNNGVCSASSPNCLDSDHDGYGAGAGCACAGLDCDDGNAAVHATDSKACYSGAAVTQNIGACHDGLTTCSNGAWSPCIGEVIPSGEACNNQDDDCNGKIDDNLGTFSCGLGECANSVNACTAGVAGVCKPLAGAAANDAVCDGKDNDCDGVTDEDCSCVYVSFLAVNPAADGTLAAPFPDIQAAIDYAVAHPMGPQNVCVAAGATCGLSHVYTLKGGKTITMANGVSVLGNYESTLGTRCNNSTTTIQPQTPEGITFPAAVQKTTALDGFKVDRFQAVTTSAVTVDGAKGAILNNITIGSSPSATNTYGVNVINGGDATITTSRIDAGLGTTESIGVRSVGSKVSIQNNCPSIDPVTGHCNAYCFNGGTQQPSIVGRAQGTGTTHAVLLQDSPGSKIETSALCRAQADIGSVVRITGNATGVQVRANAINGFGALNEAYGISMDACNDTAPWIVDNEVITTQGGNANTVMAAVKAIGKCHPVIDSNTLILGGAEGQASSPIGVYCGADAQGNASKCVVLNNGAIRGSGACFPPTSTGIKCDDGGCNRIANNRLITGRGAAMDSVGVLLGSTGTSVENNVIQGGCAGTNGTPGTSTGIRMNDSFARLENNRIFGYMPSDCKCNNNPAGNTTSSYGVQVLLKSGAHEVDVHSNDIDGGGASPGGVMTCASRGVIVDLSAGGTVKQGIFRNNIFRGGSCGMSRVNFLEAVAGADPRIVENNDFDPAGSPSALYFNEGITALTMATEINTMLPDITTSLNISADPMFMAYPMDVHIKAGSPCINAGTVTGAPVIDMDGKMRDAMPDIGADEF